MKTIIIMIVIFIPHILFSQENSPKLLEPLLIMEDIDSLITTLKNVHPTFAYYYDEENLQVKIDSIKKGIDKPISALEFFRIMQPLISIDGHTTLTYTDKIYPVFDNPFFPFKVIIHNKKIIIKENLRGIKSLQKGNEIQKINGVSSGKIIQNLARYIPGELEPNKLKKLEKRFHIFYRLVYGSFPEFNVCVNTREIKVPGAKWGDFKEPDKPKFELRFYDNDIAYIYKRSFKPPRDFLTFMDSAFTEISKRKIKFLIIDNLEGGGLTDLADSLISYFTDNQYKLFDKKMTKISPLTNVFIESKKSEGIVENGFFVQEYSTHSSNRKNLFNGQTIILNGPLSYSTATCFPAAAKCYKAAIIVGEETGQPLVSNGDLNRFFLRNTNLACFTSLSKIYMSCNNDENEERGVVPDYEVKPTLDDLLDNKNYSLIYTLKLIRENRRNKLSKEKQ
ncbi:MAG: S41 family peptidase [Ignavibacteria bacterium]